MLVASIYVGLAHRRGRRFWRSGGVGANVHGGNAALRKREPSDYVSSVLQLAGSTATADDILAADVSWKCKLLTREHGLTRN